MATIPKLEKFMGVPSKDIYWQWVEQLQQLSDDAWKERRFAESRELTRLAELHEKQLRSFKGKEA